MGVNSLTAPPIWIPAAARNGEYRCCKGDFSKLTATPQELPEIPARVGRGLLLQVGHDPVAHLPGNIEGGLN